MLFCAFWCCLPFYFPLTYSSTLRRVFLSKQEGLRALRILRSTWRALLSGRQILKRLSLLVYMIRYFWLCSTTDSRWALNETCDCLTGSHHTRRRSRCFPLWCSEHTSNVTAYVLDSRRSSRSRYPPSTFKHSFRKRVQILSLLQFII